MVVFSFVVQIIVEMLVGVKAPIEPLLGIPWARVLFLIRLAFCMSQSLGCVWRRRPISVG